MMYKKGFNGYMEVIKFNPGHQLFSERKSNDTCLKDIISLKKIRVAAKLAGSFFFDTISADILGFDGAF